MAKKLNKKTKKKKYKTISKRKKKDKTAAKSAVMDSDAIYSRINEAQIKRVEQYLIVSIIDSPMVENILKDCKIDFKKSEKNDAIHYVIQPPPEEKISDEEYEFDEEYDDELQDDEQCF
jgi:hypothetical protein